MEFFSALLRAMPGAVAQGLLWGVMALGVYVTYKILDYADLTVDGSLALGGAVSAILVKNGMDPFLSLLFATVAGMAAGAVTGLLHTKLKIPAILSGILSMIALYSINIRIMGTPNISFGLKIPTMVKIVREWFPALSQEVATILIGGVFLAVIVGFLYWFFGTEVGSAIRATGNNEYMARALGVSTDWMKILALLISNALVSLSGAMIAQYQGYSDVKMGTGAIVTGLASVIIGLVVGEAVCRKKFPFAIRLIAVVFGSVLYRIIIALVLQLGLSTDDLKLFTAIIVAVALAIPYLKSRIFKGRKKQKGGTPAC